MGKWRNQVRKAHTAVVMKVWEAKTKLAETIWMEQKKGCTQKSKKGAPETSIIKQQYAKRRSRH